MTIEQLNVNLAAQGYEPLGGMTNRLFVHPKRGEVLRIAVTDDLDARRWKRQDFANCRAASPLFAPRGLMPEVLDGGDDWAGTGWPYLLERFVAGANLSVAYLADPGFWDEHLPGEIVRIYRALLAASGDAAENAAPFWHNKAEWLDELRASPHFACYADLHAACRNAALALAQKPGVSHHLHGDLQLANLLVTKPGRVLLLDWELTQNLPLAFEFAHFHANLLDPVPQISEDLKADYAAIRPLKKLWENLAPRLWTEFGVGGAALRRAILVHRAGWLFRLDRALAQGRPDQAELWQNKLGDYVSGKVFQQLPVPDGSRSTQRVY